MSIPALAEAVDDDRSGWAGPYFGNCLVDAWCAGCIHYTQQDFVRCRVDDLHLGYIFQADVQGVAVRRSPNAVRQHAGLDRGEDAATAQPVLPQSMPKVDRYRPSCEALIRKQFHMSYSICFDIWLTQSVVRQFDEQILECVEDEDLTAQQRNELLAWAHNHLFCAYLAIQLDRYRDLTVEPVSKRFIRPCRTVIDMISQMLQGGIPLGEDMTFHCPPSICPQTLVFNRKLSAWLRHRIALAAQRTCLHTGMELDAIWKSIESYFVTCALVWFELADWLDVEVPDAETLDATTRDCLDAVRGKRGLAWTPAGVILQG